MTDSEFELLDALYFTVSFDCLIKEFDFSEEVLVNELIALIQKAWVKCLDKVSEEEIVDIMEIKRNFNAYNFLASKEGLLAHNSR